MGIRTHAGDGLCCQPFRWRNGAQAHLGVVLKASFAVNHQGVMRLLAPAPIVFGERFANNNPGRGVADPDDLVPHLPMAEFVLRGKSHGSAGRRQVRAALERGKTTLFEKCLVVQADSEHPVELGWNDALQTPSNPFGRPDPIVLDPRRPEQPGCFLPVTKHAQARKALLGTLPMPRRRDDWMDVPATVDWGFFQCVPEDQRLPRLELNERLILEGVHPQIPCVESSLPGLNAYCYISYSPVQPWVLLPVTADRLLVDTEAMTVAVTWRGAVAFHDEPSIRNLRLYAELAEKASDVQPCMATDSTEPIAFPPASQPTVVNRRETIELSPSVNEPVWEAAQRSEPLGDEDFTLAVEEPQTPAAYLPFRPAADKNEGSPPGSIRAPRLVNEPTEIAATTPAAATAALSAPPVEPSGVALPETVQATVAEEIPPHPQKIYRVQSPRDAKQPESLAAQDERASASAAAPKRPPPVDVAAELYGSFR